jgi:hypothetical protein
VKERYATASLRGRLRLVRLVPKRRSGSLPGRPHLSTTIAWSANPQTVQTAAGIRFRSVHDFLGTHVRFHDHMNVIGFARVPPRDSSRGARAHAIFVKKIGHLGCATWKCCPIGFSRGATGGLSPGLPPWTLAAKPFTRVLKNRPLRSNNLRLQPQFPPTSSERIKSGNPIHALN